MNRLRKGVPSEKWGGRPCLAFSMVIKCPSENLFRPTSAQYFPMNLKFGGKSSTRVSVFKFQIQVHRNIWSWGCPKKIFRMALVTPLFWNVFLRDNFVIFRHRSKRITFLESVNFSACVYVQIFNFRDVHVTDHFLAQFRGLYTLNASSQTLQTSKRHTFRVSAFHQYHWFGVKLFPLGCAQDSWRVP